MNSDTELILLWMMGWDMALGMMQGSRYGTQCLQSGAFIPAS